MMFEIDKVDFQKGDGLVPAVIQDHITGKVLMLGYMNKESLQRTLDEKKVCFYSRSKSRLWTKGEESGNFLHLKNIKMDCDRDSLLLSVEPEGVVCHTGSDTCWDEENAPSLFLLRLEQIIRERKSSDPSVSYTASLFSKGINKVAQKVGEEAVELVIEAKDANDELFLNEAADLMFHFLVLLQFKGYTLQDISDILESRHR